MAKGGVVGRKGKGRGKGDAITQDGHQALWTLRAPPCGDKSATETLKDETRSFGIGSLGAVGEIRLVGDV